MIIYSSETENDSRILKDLRSADMRIVLTLKIACYNKYLYVYVLMFVDFSELMSVYGILTTNTPVP